MGTGGRGDDARLPEGPRLRDGRHLFRCARGGVEVAPRASAGRMAHVGRARLPKPKAGHATRCEAGREVAPTADAAMGTHS